MDNYSNCSVSQNSSTTICADDIDLTPLLKNVQIIDNVQSPCGPQFNSTMETEDIFVPRLFGILMLISSTFLLFTFIVYALLWKQQNIHGYAVMAHTASMYLTYVFFATTHIIRRHFPRFINTRICFVNGVLTHFFLLSTFCWLTLISCNLWWTFRSIHPTKSQGRLKWALIIHMTIGWGIPLVIVLLSIFLDLHFADGCTKLLLPKYGQQVCYVAVNSQGPYIYYPAATTLFINMVCFCVTLFKIHQYKKSTQFATKNQRNNRHKLLKVYTKLFFVTGMLWIIEFFFWLHVDSLAKRLYWLLIDISNILQAGAIFFIYVCKLDILQALEKTYPNSVMNKYFLSQIRRHFVKVPKVNLSLRQSSSSSPRHKRKCEPSTTKI